MGICKKYDKNLINKRDISVRMESLRSELYNIFLKGEGTDNKVIDKSQELDNLLNEYYRNYGKKR